MTRTLAPRHLPLVVPFRETELDPLAEPEKALEIKVRQLL